jgi:murein DD-endopeptidase MepM/ murein hydrolase activator NlpD
MKTRTVALTLVCILVLGCRTMEIDSPELTESWLEQVSVAVDKAGDAQDLDTLLAHIASEAVISTSFPANSGIPRMVFSKDTYATHLADTWSKTRDVSTQRLKTEYRIATNGQSATVISTLRQTATIREAGVTFTSTGKQVSEVRLIDGTPKATKIDVTISKSDLKERMVEHLVRRSMDCMEEYDWETSPYVLPYPKGKSYFVNQANCSGFGHSGIYKYGYDFVMPIGSEVCASRDGVVSEIRDLFEDGDLKPSHSNWVKIKHEDGNITAYSHLSRGSVLVKPGDHVKAGDVIGLSGNSGDTGGLPHLHLHLSECSEPVDCGTLPFVFSNTDPNPKGLLPQRYYEAR